MLKLQHIYREALAILWEDFIMVQSAPDLGYCLLYVWCGTSGHTSTLQSWMDLGCEMSMCKGYENRTPKTRISGIRESATRTNDRWCEYLPLEIAQGICVMEVTHCRKNIEVIDFSQRNHETGSQLEHRGI